LGRFTRWYVDRKISVGMFSKHPELMQKGESFLTEQIVIDSA